MKLARRRKKGDIIIMTMFEDRGINSTVSGNCVSLIAYT